VNAVDSTGERQLVLVFGGPGAGKGTQAELLSRVLGHPHISSGDLLRARNSDAAGSVMTRGDLLPDEVVTEIMLNRLAQPDARRGAILDGFPRTLAQARALDDWLTKAGGQVRGAVYLEVPDDELVKRLAERSVLSGRADDQAHSAPRRLDVFLREMPPVLQYYADRGLLRRVDGNQSIEDVHNQVVRVL